MDDARVLSVVVPVYNEEATLAELHRRLAAVLSPLGAHEIVLVDDGSRDGSWQVMTELADLDGHVRLVRLSRNFGHQTALTAGLDAAVGNAVVTIDGDLQDPPEVIPQLVDQWRAGFDVVYAVREERPGEARWRLVAIRAFYRLLARMAGHDIPQNVGDFRLLSRRAVDAIASMPERSRFLRGMSTWVGFRQVGVLYKRDTRFAGESKYPPAKLVRLALDGITSFSTMPLQIVTWLGLVSIVFCLVVFAWTIFARFFESHTPQGWTSLLMVVLLLGGVQMVSLGIIGQYIARIFDESKKRPLYFVADAREPRSLD